MATRRRRAKGTGTIRCLPSGRWQAVTRNAEGKRCPAPQTFDAKMDAVAWLAGQPTADEAPRPTVPTLTAYATAWVSGRELKPRTRVLYNRILTKQISPELGATRLDKITPAQVRAWYGSLDASKATTRAHAYSLLKTILATAVTDDLIATNPCRIRGAASSPPRHNPPLVALPELGIMVEAMPPRLRAM